jgi:hypothetical protein
MLVHTERDRSGCPVAWTEGNSDSRTICWFASKEYRTGHRSEYRVQLNESWRRNSVALSLCSAGWGRNTAPLQKFFNTTGTGKERATDLSVKGEAGQAPYFPCQTAEKKKAGPLGARFLDR